MRASQRPLNGIEWLSGPLVAICVEFVPPSVRKNGAPGLQGPMRCRMQSLRLAVYYLQVAERSEGALLPPMEEFEVLF